MASQVSGTVEEKMLALQKSKRALAEATLGGEPPVAGATARSPVLATAPQRLRMADLALCLE